MATRRAEKADVYLIDPKGAVVLKVGRFPVTDKWGVKGAVKSAYRHARDLIDRLECGDYRMRGEHCDGGSVQEWKTKTVSEWRLPGLDSAK
jgi:hypothetical protein